MTATIGLLAALITLVFFCPAFVLWRGLDIPDLQSTPGVNRAVDVLKQIDHPFTPVVNPSNKVIEWRLLFPVIWHLVPLPRLLLLGLPWIGCWLVLMTVVDLTNRAGLGRFWSLLAATIMAMMSWFFVSTGWLTYGDSWVALGLLTVAFSSDVWLIFIVCLLVPWIDERFVIGIPVAVLAGYCYESSGTPPSGSRKRWFLSLIGLTPYLGIRLISVILHPHTQGSIENLFSNGILHSSFSQSLAGLWQGMRMGWVFALAGMGICWGRGTWILRIVLLLTTTGMLLVLLTLADDLSRAMVILLPWCLIGINEIWKWNPWVAKAGLVIGIVLNLLLPAAHVVSEFSIPVRPVWTEIDQWRHLNPYNDARIRTHFAATEFIPDGDMQGALAQLDAAVKSDPKYVGAYLLRGWVNANLGRLDPAMADAIQATTIDPAQPDGWMIQGMILSKHGDAARARECLNRVLQLTGPDYPYRAQCLEALSNASQPDDKRKK